MYIKLHSQLVKALLKIDSGKMRCHTCKVDIEVGDWLILIPKEGKYRCNECNTIMQNLAHH
jgi:hypothetical protein